MKSAAEIVAGYSTYTDADELGRTEASQPRSMPTTTVMTTTLHCLED
ncbi:MAG: LxmA leader domain family RiPP [Nocardiopsaceae bacterium]|nr:LxmA leader domain family RiPP [Nocardiopsaceae bacterium]